MEFTLARKLNRQIFFHLGPTNSGKTHDALIQLQKAKSGVYLAPLRLLAMEIRDRLMEANVPCNLITGEERQIIEGAKHTSSTIEMMNPNIEVDVAIIDEIQMIQDQVRGSSWTAALIGVPAKQVYVCGANSVTEPCIRTIESLSETYHVHYFERKTPLIVENEALSGNNYNRWVLKKKLCKGDAVIAFSRKDVLTLSARFRQWGFKVASIYGALSPEVRRTESERFNRGSADILVATDAIGMGLNLPIKRIVFSTIEKFDGYTTRNINATETRQIAGRAGRYGIYPEGYVSAFENDDLIHIEHMLNYPDTSEIKKLPVAPNFIHINKISTLINTNRISEILVNFSEEIEIENSLFEIGSLSVQIEQARIVDEYAPNLPLHDKMIFVYAPISLDKSNERDYFLSCIDSVLNSRKKSLPRNVNWLDSISAKHLEEAEFLAKEVSLYAWLGFKYPMLFTELADIPSLRNKISRYIERALLIQAGYKETSKEILYQLDKR